MKIKKRTCMGGEGRKKQSHMSMLIDDILDDLFARFVLNLPKEELESGSRLGFQLEQAWWFYDDFYRAETPSLPKMNLKKFIQVLLERFPEWSNLHGIDADRVTNEFLKYKAQVPVCGAILLNQDLTKCLMVKGWGSGTWTFPKGKIAKDEAPEQCAIREVIEEIGFDISSHINPAEYLQMETGPQSARLYLIHSIPESTTFQTLTRKEIGAIKWFPIAELTNQKSDSKFYNVSKFIGRLKAYAKRMRKSLGLVPEQPSAPSPTVKKLAKKIAQKLKEPKQPLQGNHQKKILVRPQQPESRAVVSQFEFRFDKSLIELAFKTAWNKNKDST